MHLSVLLVAFLGFSCNVNAETSKYTVALDFEGKGVLCAATIIGENFLVTSGECFSNKMHSRIEVPSVTAVVDGKVVSKAAAVYLPYFYAGRGRAIHDFAVIKLKESLNLQENGLAAVRLPTGETTYDYNYHKGTVGSVSTLAGGEESVEVVDFKDCMANGYGSLLVASQICAKSQSSNKKCSGDHGSPIVEGSDLLIGVQLECKADSPYELFAKVSYFRSIIDLVVAGQPGPYSTHNFA